MNSVRYLSCPWITSQLCETLANGNNILYGNPLYFTQLRTMTEVWISVAVCDGYAA